MIAYHDVNKYLDSIELPKSMEEVLSYEYLLEDKEQQFIRDAKSYLRENIDFESYRLKEVHCLGTCLINLTRTGLYFLLDDEIIGVHRSILRNSAENPGWTITQYRFREIKELDFDNDASGGSQYESGSLFLKVLNEKGAVRHRTFRNLNPHHFQCFQDFYNNIKQSPNT